MPISLGVIVCTVVNCSMECEMHANVTTQYIFQLKHTGMPIVSLREKQR